MADAVLAAAAGILERALVLLRDRRGIDFSGYRRSTIERRLANRMITMRMTDGDRYLALLEESDREVASLASNLAIKVSRFYRNAAAFDVLADPIIPSLRQALAGDPLKIWSAGCALGEEAYTLAMLLRDGDRVDATDIDEPALSAARLGRYALAALAETPPHLVRDLLEPVVDEPQFVDVSAHLRQRVRFFRHDLAAADTAPDPPYHLICCRNVLIYFNRPLQVRVMRLLRDSLAPGGVLCLGEAEWPMPECSELETIDRRNRIFRRVGGTR